MHLAPQADGPVTTEADIYESRLALDGRRIVDLGCGAAEHSRRIAATGQGRTVIAFDTDEVQLARNLRSAFPANLEFRTGGAQRIELAADSVDVVMMFKSLHHVPLERMDQAMFEIHRVLVPNGTLYVSEPVFDGALNEIIRLFHDEQVVREAAFAALTRAVEQRRFELVEEVFYLNAVHFDDFEAFDQRLISVTHSDHDLPDDLLAEVERRFSAHDHGEGADFHAPMRVDILRKR